jgi:stage II sporulation protein E
MQYGAELLTYQRTKRAQKSKKAVDYSSPLKLIIYCAAAILISRVMLVNKTAPFGVAFIFAVIMHKEEKLALAAGCGALLGYISLYKNIENLGLYVIIILTITAASYIMESLSKKRKLAAIFGVVFIEAVVYNFFINNYSIGVNMLFSAFDIACIFPLYFMMDYGLSCFKEIKTKHLFTNEEIISMAILLSLAVSGTWGAVIYGISIRNIVALAAVIVISYINGSAIGASSGVAMGVIVGMSTNNMIAFIGVYGLCGLTVGLFRETGKWLSGLAYIVAFAILKLYSDIGNDFKIIEGIITCGILFGIPQNIYDRLSMEFDWEKKQEKLSESHVDKIKDIFVGRLENFSDVLFNMSEIVNSLINNDKLLMKNKSSALIENLADRVCANCDMNSMCWKRELHYTYSAFGELIQSYQDNKERIPEELERKCVKRTSLVKNTEDIVNNFIISEMWRNRLTEGRQILAGQINNMAASIGEIVNEFNSTIKFNNEVERNVRRLLNKGKIKINDMFCMEDRKGRIIVKISMEACGGRQSCVKEMLPLINEAAGVSMCISDEGCSIDPNTNMCSVTFEEMPKYHVSSYVGRECKSGEKYNGDSYSFGKLKDGTYMMIISDGMGSGPEAGQESRAAVELIEKFTEAGFSKTTAINTVNSIMTLKFTEDEKFSTLDLSSIDLYSGDIDFMKVGAVASYLKRGDKVEAINSKTLPIGVLDKVDIDISSKKIKNGDIVVMLSDGLLDCTNGDGRKRDWIMDYLESTTCSNPKEIAEEIMERAGVISKGKPKDDMTVLVSKVYSLY